MHEPGPRPDDTAALAVADQAITDINRNLDTFVVKTAEAAASIGPERATVGLFTRLTESGMPTVTLAALAAVAIARLAPDADAESAADGEDCTPDLADPRAMLWLVDPKAVGVTSWPDDGAADLGRFNVPLVNPRRDLRMIGWGIRDGVVGFGGLLVRLNQQIDRLMAPFWPVNIPAAALPLKVRQVLSWLINMAIQGGTMFSGIALTGWNRPFWPVWAMWVLTGVIAGKIVQVHLRSHPRLLNKPAPRCEDLVDAMPRGWNVVDALNAYACDLDVLPHGFGLEDADPVNPTFARAIIPGMIQDLQQFQQMLAGPRTGGEEGIPS